MVTLDQYPHYLYFQVLSESTRDANGTWRPQTATWSYLCQCRIERNGQAAQITTADGKVFVFSATVYMPRNSTPIPLPIGTRIIVAKERYEDPETITDDFIKAKQAAGEILIDKPNATHEIGRLHNRMWV
ncbi:MAG: hypothetical protein II480_11145 [Bacteroidales bacterium]|nr:hypothetical protein [Bacteroidales bacterium]